MKLNYESEGFIDRLRTAMEEKGITASELSQASNVGKSDISRYMKGEYLPKQDKCFKLASALGVDPWWLMSGYEPEHEEPASFYFRQMQENHEGELMEFCELFINMKPRQQKTAMKMLRTIAEDEDE